MDTASCISHNKNTYGINPFVVCQTLMLSISLHSIFGKISVYPFFSLFFGKKKKNFLFRLQNFSGCCNIIHGRTVTFAERM